MGNYNQVNLKCFCCQEVGHFVNNCPMVHLILQKEYLCVKLQNKRHKAANFIRLGVNGRFSRKFNSRDMFPKIKETDFEMCMTDD